MQVDVGKTFRESMITCYRAHGVEEIDAVLLTHNHADAVNGLDELRTLQVLYLLWHYSLWRYTMVMPDYSAHLLRCSASIV